MDYKEIIDLLRSIQSADDFQEKRESLFKVIEQFVNTHLETLRKLQSSALSQEQIKMEFAKFQQDWETMGMELEPEFNRLDTIPGIAQLSDSVQNEFLKRIEPMAKEGEQLMNKLKGEDASGSPMPPPPRKQIERQKLDELETLYGIKTIDELIDSKDKIIDKIGEGLKKNIQKLQSFKNKPKEEYMNEYQEIMNNLDIFENEGSCEFERLKTLPGGAEYVGTFQQDMIGRLGPLLDEIDQLSEELK